MTDHHAKPHIVSVLMLLAAAALPMEPLATNSAYRDTETSQGNFMQAGVWGGAEEQKVLLSEPLLAPSLFSIELGEPAVEDTGADASSTEDENAPQEKSTDATSTETGTDKDAPTTQQDESVQQDEEEVVEESQQEDVQEPEQKTPEEIPEEASQEEERSVPNSEAQ